MTEKEILLNQFSSLVNAMDDPEIDIAKKHIIAYDSNNTGFTQKMFQIFSEITSKQDIEYEELKNRISPEVADLSFNRQLRRTLYRVQESLIIDVNLKRKGLYDGIFRKRYEIRKRLMEASILHGKGLPEMAARVFDSIIKTTKLYELYDELIEALVFKQSINIVRKGKKGYAALNNQINFYNRSRDLFQKTKNIYQTYTSELFTKGRKKEKVKFLIKHLTEINTYFLETNSDNIRSYYLLLKMEYCYNIDDFKGEELAGVELLNLMVKSKAVYSKGRIIYVCNSLANSMIANLKFKESYKYIEKSIHVYDTNVSVRYVNALQQQITSLFYLGEYKKAEKVEKELNFLKILEKYPFHQSISAYQKAMIQFAMGHFNEARLLLTNLKEIEKDKEGWNVWTKIMRIMCSIELLRLNLIDYDVENFRKYIQRIDKQYEVRNRDKIVLKVLQDLDRYDYDFEVVSEKSVSLIKQLKSSDANLKWDPKSPEMILFHDWFDAKLEKRNYAPNFEPYRKKIADKAKKNLEKELLSS